MSPTRPHRRRNFTPIWRPAAPLSVEPTQTYLNQIERHDSRVRAFLRVDAGSRSSRGPPI